MSIKPNVIRNEDFLLVELSDAVSLHPILTVLIPCRAQQMESADALGHRNPLLFEGTMLVLANSSPNAARSLNENTSHQEKVFLKKHSWYSLENCWIKKIFNDFTFCSHSYSGNNCAPCAFVSCIQKNARSFFSSMSWYGEKLDVRQKLNSSVWVGRYFETY